MVARGNCVLQTVRDENLVPTLCVCLLICASLDLKPSPPLHEGWPKMVGGPGWWAKIAFYVVFHRILCVGGPAGPPRPPGIPGIYVGGLRPPTPPFLPAVGLPEMLREPGRPPTIFKAFLPDRAAGKNSIFDGPGGGQKLPAARPAGRPAGWPAGRLICGGL